MIHPMGSITDITGQGTIGEDIYHVGDLLTFQDVDEPLHKVKPNGITLPVSVLLYCTALRRPI